MGLKLREKPRELCADGLTKSYDSNLRLLKRMPKKGEIFVLQAL